MPYKDSKKRKEYQKRYYKNNKPKYQARQLTSRLAVRDAVNKIKEERGCLDCGTSYPYYVLDFDHRNGRTKFGEIRDLIRNNTLKVILKEIKKCDVVCANCHRERTQRRILEKKARRKK